MVSLPESNGSQESHPKEKLVRDKIPEIIAKREGVRPRTRIVQGAELENFLREKLIEEIRELLTAEPENRPEEMADVKTVLQRLSDHWKLNLKQVTDEFADKRDKKGGFDAGIVMELEEEASSPEQYSGSGI